MEKGLRGRVRALFKKGCPNGEAPHEELEADAHQDAHEPTNPHTLNLYRCTNSKTNINGEENRTLIRVFKEGERFLKAEVVLAGLIMVLAAIALFFIAYSQQHLIYDVTNMVDLGILPSTITIPTIYGTNTTMDTVIFMIKSQYGGFFLNNVIPTGNTIYVYYSSVIIAACLIIGLLGLYAIAKGAQS